MGKTSYYLYFAGFDGKTEQVGVAVSADQQHWKISHEPIIPVGKSGEWDSWQTSNPSVLHESGIFRMWYQGVDDGGRYRIGYAESADGWHFEKRRDVIFERRGLASLKNVPHREGYHQPQVFKEGNRYWMYFLDHRDGLGYIRAAQSQDGLQWEVFPDDCLKPEKSWESHGLHYPWVLVADSQYTLWYTSQGEKTRWYLNRATSEDGIHWQRDPANHPIIDIRLPRTVSMGHYWMPRKLLRLYPHYHHPNVRAYGLKADPAAKNRLNKVLVWLHDRIIFPFRERRYVGFDNSSIVKMAGGSYLMYFQAVTESVSLVIGSATSPDGIHWQPQQMDILRPIIRREQIAWCAAFDGDPHLLIVET